jgi:hypothetical protein
MVLLDPEKTAKDLNHAADSLRGSNQLFTNPNIPEIDPGLRDVVEKKILTRKENLDRITLDNNASSDKKDGADNKDTKDKPAGK